MAKKLKAPWQVYCDKLRPQFPKKIVEIVDVKGNTVLPWGGFDATGLSVADQKRLALRIVHAVNTVECA